MTIPTTATSATAPTTKHARHRTRRCHRARFFGFVGHRWYTADDPQPLTLRLLAESGLLPGAPVFARALR